MKKEYCGVFGTVCQDENLTSGIIYNGLLSLQHRGQDSSGIAVLNDSTIKLKKFKGIVVDTIPKSFLTKTKGKVGVGHVRYTTVGSSKLSDAAPFKLNYPKRGIVFSHNGNIVNYMCLKKELAQNGRLIGSRCDAEMMVNVLAEELIKSKDYEDAILGLMERVEGAYSVASFTGEGDLLVFRDPNAFRPLCYGKTDGIRAFASESVALQTNKIELESDVKAGELIITNSDGMFERKQIFSSKNVSHCMFEYVYISRPDSVVDGKSVYDVRVRLGRNLAKTYAADADVIVPVPDTSRPAAKGISQETGIPYAEGLIKNRYIGRTFIMPNQVMRDNAVTVKLNPIKSVLKDKKVILVDDSIVRGTTSKKIVKLVKSAGPKSVDVWITCPPIISPCFYGIDISTHGELIAANNKVPQIEKIIGADKLCYQTIDGLVDSIGFDRSKLCMACLTGQYPTPMAQKIADKMKKQTSFKKIRYWEREL